MRSTTWVFPTVRDGNILKSLLVGFLPILILILLLFFPFPPPDEIGWAGCDELWKEQGHASCQWIATR